nr:dermokine isoform X2 [Cavia porcellus]
MKLQVSLACLLLALCLGSGAAGPLQGSGAGAGQGLGDAITNGVGKAIGEGAKEAVSSGIQDAIGKGDSGEASSAFRARGDALSNRLGEAAHALENTGNEAGKQAEKIIRHEMDVARNPTSWGTSGGHGMFGPYGSHGGQGQGNFGSLGSLSGHGNPGGSESSFETNSLGGSTGQGGNGWYSNLETSSQRFSAQPGYSTGGGSSQNSGCTNAPPTTSSGSPDPTTESSSQGSGSGSSGGHGGSSGGHGGNSGSSSGSNRDTETSRDFDESFSVSKDTGSDTGSRHTGGGGNKPECDNPGNEVRVAGGARNEETRESSELGSFHGNSQRQRLGEDGKENEAVSELNSVTLKSKLGFINWDALNKGQVLYPSTRLRLYLRRLWDDFKRRTPFFNWKEITEDVEMPFIQKRTRDADQKNQQVYPTASSGKQSLRSTPKGAATASSSASRMQPSLLHWLKFW